MNISAIRRVDHEPKRERPNEVASTGYKLVRFTANDRTPQDFLTGFYQRTKIPGKPDDVRVLGRPCGIYRTGPDSFLVTDDIQGTIYAIYPKRNER